MEKMKIDWKAKLASRKFWMALGGFIVSVLALFNVAETDITKVTAMITAFGSLAVFIFAEGYIDGKREENNPNDKGVE